MEGEGEREREQERERERERNSDLERDRERVLERVLAVFFSSVSKSSSSIPSGPSSRSMSMSWNHHVTNLNTLGICRRDTASHLKAT